MVDERDVAVGNVVVLLGPGGDIPELLGVLLNTGLSWAAALPQHTVHQPPLSNPLTQREGVGIRFLPCGSVSQYRCGGSPRI